MTFEVVELTPLLFLPQIELKRATIALLMGFILLGLLGLFFKEEPSLLADGPLQVQPVDLVSEAVPLLTVQGIGRVDH